MCHIERLLSFRALYNRTWRLHRCSSRWAGAIRTQAKKRLLSIDWAMLCSRDNGWRSVSSGGRGWWPRVVLNSINSEGFWSPLFANLINSLTQRLMHIQVMISYTKLRKLLMLCVAGSQTERCVNTLLVCRQHVPRLVSRSSIATLRYHTATNAVGMFSGSSRCLNFFFLVYFGEPQPWYK